MSEFVSYFFYQYLFSFGYGKMFNGMQSVSTYGIYVLMYIYLCTYIQRHINYSSRHSPLSCALIV